MAKELPISRGFIAGAIALLSICASPGVSFAQKHQPTFECANTGALRVTCRGSYLDGTSAAGIIVRVYDRNDRVVHVGTVDRTGRVTFRKPDAEFHVVFDAGQGNVLTILGSEMT
jgi:hypothetical protein